ncbi:hypothetical protein N9O24_00955 [bacterium]|nr:hypothetical protein [bacterium]
MKLNTATILREDALFRAKQEQEAAKINAYEAELRDSSDFYRWQTDMRAKDQKTRLEQIARTRVLAKASAEEANYAKMNKLLDNRQLAARSVDEGRAMQKQRQLEADMTLLKKRHLVGEVKEERETAPRHAVERILKKKNEIRESVQRDMDIRLKHREDEENARARVLAEHVKRLKAEHSVHRDHTNFFDPTDTVGLGLLDEMSLVEMQERLAKNLKRDEEHREQKRIELLENKNAKRERLAERVENIKKVREAAAEKNQQTRLYQSRRAFDLSSAIQNEEERLLLQLVRGLKDKRVALSDYRRKLQEEEARTKKDQLFAGAGEQLKEKKAHEELLKGAERMAKDKQRHSLETMAKYNTSKSRERHQSEHNRILKEGIHRKAHTRREESVKEAAHEMLRTQKEEITGKKKRYFHHKRAHAEKMEVIADPYTEHINEKSVTRARRHAAHRQETAMGA